MSVAGGRIAAGVGANLIGQHAQDRNQDATVYVGNLDPQVCTFNGRFSAHGGWRPTSCRQPAVIPLLSLLLHGCQSWTCCGCRACFGQLNLPSIGNAVPCR